MFRGTNSNTVSPSFLDNHFQYPADMSNQLKLCGNVPIEFQADTVNYFGKNNGPQFLLQNRCGTDGEAIPNQQKVHFSLNNNNNNYTRPFHEDPERKASILNLNPVSTGLRLSYDDDNERNSSITSASGSLTAAASLVFSALSNDIKREIDQQNKEFDQFIRIQEENMLKGMRNIHQRHMASFLTALEKNVAKKMYEKDLELETLTLRNKELVETVKQATSEAQNWCYMARYNKSVVNVLKTNLQQAMQFSNNNVGKEGAGESEDADDAASFVDPNNQPSGSVPSNAKCRSCKAKEVSVLWMPCRHLCPCRECERFVGVCPYVRWRLRLALRCICREDDIKKIFYSVLRIGIMHAIANFTI